MKGLSLMSVPNFRKSYHTVLGAAIDFPLQKNNNKKAYKYSCKQRCGFLLRLRSQGKMYILYNFGKKSKRRKEEWKKERIEERRVKKEGLCLYLSFFPS